MSRTSLAVFALAALAACPAGAQFPESGGNPAHLDGFTVAGKGMAVARPNRLEIDLEVSAASELTADAIVKYRDAKKRLQDAFTTLKLSNVAIEEKALAVGPKSQAYNPYFGMGEAPARKGKVEVQLTRKLVVVCTSIRELDEEALLQLVAKLLDVAQDAGGKVNGGASYNPYFGAMSGGGGMVRFVLDDLEALQEKAYQAAIADARTRAGRLAKLSGVELGRVAGVREVVVPGEKPQQSQSFSFYGGMQQSDEEEPPRRRIETAKFQEVPVRVEIQVRFEVAPAAKPRGAEAAR